MAVRTAADPGIHQARHPEEVAAAVRTDHRGVGHRTVLVLAAAAHTARPEGGHRTGRLEEERHIGPDLEGAHHTVPEVVRRIGQEVAAGHTLAGAVRHTGCLGERRIGLERDGWSSRPWSRSFYRWRRGGV